MICPAPPVPERALASPSNRRPRDRAILDAHIGGPPSSSRTSLDRLAEPVPPLLHSRTGLSPRLRKLGHHGQESRPYRFSCIIDDTQAYLSDQTTNKASLRNAFVVLSPVCPHTIVDVGPDHSASRIILARPRFRASNPITCRRAVNKTAYLSRPWNPFWQLRGPQTLRNGAVGVETSPPKPPSRRLRSSKQHHLPTFISILQGNLSFDRFDSYLTGIVVLQASCSVVMQSGKNHRGPSLLAFRSGGGLPPVLHFARREFARPTGPTAARQI